VLRTGRLLASNVLKDRTYTDRQRRTQSGEDPRAGGTRRGPTSLPPPWCSIHLSKIGAFGLDLHGFTRECKQLRSPPGNANAEFYESVLVDKTAHVTWAVTTPPVPVDSNGASQIISTLRSGDVQLTDCGPSGFPSRVK
jgi:hypothetical protein